MYVFLPTEFFKDDVILRKNIPAELLTTHKCLVIYITYNFSFSTDLTENQRKNCLCLTLVIIDSCFVDFVNAMHTWEMKIVSEI